MTAVHPVPAGPKLVICLLTYQRTDYALRCIDTVVENLRFDGPIGWYVGDDGSAPHHVGKVIDALSVRDAEVIGMHSQRMGPGPSWNRAIEKALEVSDFWLHLEEDWTLNRELDVTPYIQLLTERTDVGMVRLGYLAVGLDLFSVGHAGRHYLQMQRSTQYAVSGNPAIRHRRFHEAYGGYPADRNPGECEIMLDAAFRAKAGPEVWWPVDLGGWSVFGHIGQQQSY